MIPFIITAMSGGSSSSTAEPTPISSPFRMLVIGDSIARGTNEELSYDGMGSDANPDTLFEFTDDDQLVEVTRDVERGYAGSPYPAMANKIKELTGWKTHIVNTAMGGTAIAPNPDRGDWQEGGNLYTNMLSKSSGYLNYVNKTSFDAIRVNLGINDVNSDSTEAHIESYIAPLIDSLTTQFPNTPIIWNPCYDPDFSLKVQAVRGFIFNAIAAYDHVYAGTDLGDIDDVRFFDGTHLDQAGNDELGELDAQLMLNALNVI